MRQIKIPSLVIAAALGILMAGCTKPTAPTESSKAPSSDNAEKNVAAAKADQAPAKLDGPAAATQEFLEALRTGNDERASKLLSKTAREKTASLNRNVTPPASDTARFKIGKIDYVNDDGARVASTWIDVDEQGQPRSDDAIWVLRREAEGWRIVGVAAQIFPGEQPLLLNFEDPDDMFRKQQWVREEIRRRMEAESLQAAQGGEKQEKPVRR
jgi:hypothetical protein